jgi:hypothetical protein
MTTAARPANGYGAARHDDVEFDPDSDEFVTSIVWGVARAGEIRWRTTWLP